MKLLLDTHAFIWWDSQPEQLSSTARAAIESPENEVLVSVVSLWEMVIKVNLGKLAVRRPLAEILQDQTDRGLELLSLSARHVFQVAELPAHHKDPFDRALVAQALCEGAVLVSHDAALPAYGIPVLW